ncbi:proline-rich extensin-like family protein [Microcystis aeruginosa NIES-843]|uniref:Proline-rich extensin-like family protein n=1 Tax=Microcystis aeruginosa (strain NIES-843 / IAM M-2473) TaxID=449447 RepID=B0JTA0_MICAN|nr:proline-rich extensin-like family protein [Microcystis aeruginosa NIES-843]
MRLVKRMRSLPRTPVMLVKNSKPLMLVPFGRLRSARVVPSMVRLRAVVATEKSASTRVSIPAPPSTVSTPPPLVIRSLLSPPLMLSSPSPPLRVSLPALPIRVSFKLLPNRLSLPLPPVRLNLSIFL